LNKKGKDFDLDICPTSNPLRFRSLRHRADFVQHSKYEKLDLSGKHRINSFRMQSLTCYRKMTKAIFVRPASNTWLLFKRKNGMTSVLLISDKHYQQEQEYDK